MRSPLAIPFERPDRDRIIIRNHAKGVAHVAGVLHMEGITSAQAEKFDGIDWWRWTRGVRIGIVRSEVKAEVIEALKALEEREECQQSRQS